MADIKLYGTLIRDDDTNTQKIVNANQVAGGFFVCASVLTSGTWQTGQLCYCTGDSKFYQYDGTEWKEKEFGTNNIATSSVLGLVKSSTTGTAANRDYNVQVNSDGTMKVNVPWTDTYTNTTYTIAAGDSDGQIKVTPSDGDAYNVSVKGLGSAAYTDSSAYAAASHTHAYKPTFSKSIYHSAAGNPQQIKFITVDYSTYDSGYAAYFKLDATSCHGNGVSYQFLEEILIGVTASGDVSLAINKSCQQSTDAVIDGTTRYYGDVFAVKDTTNKKVDFYILGGQWCNSSYSNLTPIGSATTAGVTQHTSFISYSSGERQWAQGCGNTCHDYLPISGGNLTGALTVNGAGGIDTDGYVTSTWLKTTDVTDLNKAASKVAVIDASGWIYYRTPAELMSDMGGVSTDTKNTAGASNKTSTKLFLVGATSQTDGIQTYSNSEVFINTSNEVEATGFYAKSDKRLKENIKEFIPTKSILELPVVEFDYINTGNHQIGCLAQDLQEICPEIVNTDENGYLSINESKLTYLLLLEVKKLKEEIKILKGE